jgi:hypothetical protein
VIRIEVISSETREVVKKATGEIFKIPEVKAYVHGIDRYPVAIRFGVGKGAPLPAPGVYELDPVSFFVGKFDALSVRSQLVLKAVAK